MQKVVTSKEDEKLIAEILSELEELKTSHLEGPMPTEHERSAGSSEHEQSSRLPKLLALRLALACSLKEPSPAELPPAQRRDGGEYNLEQVTGMGRSSWQDLTDSMRVLLSVRHNEDLFIASPDPSDPEAMQRRFVELLYAHIYRGLRLIKRATQAHKPLLEFIAEYLFEVRERRAGGSRLEARLRHHRVEVLVLEEVLGGCSQGMLLKCLTAEGTGRLEELLPTLAFDLGWEQESTFLRPGPEPEQLWLETALPFAQWLTFGAAEVEAWLQRPQRDDTSLLVAMRHVKGQPNPITIDLDGGTLHWIWGDAKSGKTTLLRTLLWQWRILNPSPARVDIFDQESDSEWKRLRHLANVSVYTLEELNAVSSSLFGPQLVNMGGNKGARLWIIDNAEALFESHPSWGEWLLTVLREPPPGLVCVLASDGRFAQELLNDQPWLEERCGSAMLMRLHDAACSEAPLLFNGGKCLQGEGDVIVFSPDGLRGRVPQLSWEQLRARLMDRKG